MFVNDVLKIFYISIDFFFFNLFILLVFEVGKFKSPMGMALCISTKLCQILPYTLFSYVIRCI